MSTPMEIVRQFYNNFAARNFTAMGERLVARALYIVSEGGVREPGNDEGKAKVVAAFRFWHNRIRPLTVRHLHVNVASQTMLGRDTRARICLEVTYELSGRCIDAAGLRGVETGGRYTLSVADFVWLNQDDQVVRIASRIRLGD